LGRIPIFGQVGDSLTIFFESKMHFQLQLAFRELACGVENASLWGAYSLAYSPTFLLSLSTAVPFLPKPNVITVVLTLSEFTVVVAFLGHSSENIPAPNSRN